MGQPRPDEELAPVLLRLGLLRMGLRLGLGRLLRLGLARVLLGLGLLLLGRLVAGRLEQERPGQVLQ